MKLWRVFVVSLAILGVSTMAYAGDLQQSAEKAAQEQARAKPTHMDKAFLVPGLALFGVGMSMALYGFLHTSGSNDFVSGQVTKESNTALGAAGLAVAAGGGAVLFIGSERARTSAAVTVGAGRVTVVKRLTW